MRAGPGIDARIGQSQPLHGPPVDQVLLHNLRGIPGRHMAVPHSLGIHDHRGPVLALVQAEGLVDAHRSSQTCGLR